MRSIGASALATSAVVFGAGQPASAHGKHYGCCHLVHEPSSYSTCRGGRNYTWFCQWTTTTGCGCCERLTPYGSVFASAYRCERT